MSSVSTGEENLGNIRIYGYMENSVVPSFILPGQECHLIFVLFLSLIKMQISISVNSEQAATF